MPQVILVERSRLCAMAAAGNVLELADSYYLGVPSFLYYSCFSSLLLQASTMEFLWLCSQV